MSRYPAIPAHELVHQNLVVVAPDNFFQYKPVGHLLPSAVVQIMFFNAHIIIDWLLPLRLSPTSGEHSAAVFSEGTPGF